MSSYLGSANAREGRVRPVRRSEAADQRRRVPFGEPRRLLLPWSEVCLHMGVADRVMLGVLREDGMVQLYREDGTRFSAPITAGEAGVYHDRKIGYYTY